MAKTEKTAKTENYSEIDDIKANLEALRSNVVELTKHMKSDGTAKSHDIMEMVNNQLHTYRTRGEEQLKNAEKHVKEKPAQSLAIAAAVGALAGILFSRR